MQVQEVMTKQPVCITKDASLEQVTKIITSKGISHVPVLSDGKLVGIISKSDLVTRFLAMLNQTSGKNYTKLLMQHMEVENVMHADPIFVRESDDIQYAAEVLLQGVFHGIPVLSESDVVVGMVTAFDLLKASRDK